MLSLSIIEAFSRLRRLYRTNRCLRAFRNGFSRNNINRYDEHQVQHLTGWVRTRISEALKSLLKAYSKDAAALIEITGEYDQEIFEEW